MFDEELEGCLDKSHLQAIAEQVLTAQDIKQGVEMGLVIAGEQRVRKLNKTYLDRDEPTDVLAFAMFSELATEQESPFVIPPDSIKHLGEVIVCYPKAVKQAGEHNHSIIREIVILIIHGILHLLGYDHDQPERACQMIAREADILKFFEGGIG